MTVELSRLDEFAVVTLNRPDALRFSMLQELARVLDIVGGGDARALLVRGAGDRAFCVGADVKELTKRALMAQKRGIELGQATLRKLDHLPIPSVAIIHGYAFGGGLDLALACTFRLATRSARMGQRSLIGRDRSLP
jgi:enoyl-CoA hydratase